jgi:hypothetical protein
MCVIWHNIRLNSFCPSRYSVRSGEWMSFFWKRIVIPSQIKFIFWGTFLRLVPHIHVPKSKCALRLKTKNET